MRHARRHGQHAVEFTDLIFAVDSIPAVFAITTDPFLVFTSNAFAILGLRSLYFALAGLMDRFHYLKVSLAVLLAVVGGKMIAHKPLKEARGEHVHFYLLGVTVLILGAGVVASVVSNRRSAQAGDASKVPGVKHGDAIAAPLCEVDLIGTGRLGVRAGYCPECEGERFARGRFDVLLGRAGRAGNGREPRHDAAGGIGRRGHCPPRLPSSKGVVLP